MPRGGKPINAGRKLGPVAKIDKDTKP